jgi:probable HAF family extracellular repeat protein
VRGHPMHLDYFWRGAISSIAVTLLIAVSGLSISVGNANATSMTDLGTLGGTNSIARGVSGNGSIVVGYSDITGNTASHAFEYSGSTMTDI